MKKVLKNIEDFLESINEEELKRNPRASVKALKIKKFIKELKKTMEISQTTNQGVLKYISPKILLEK